MPLPFFCPLYRATSTDWYLKMPIKPDIQLKPITDSQFAAIDEVVMRCAFSVQNRFGRLFDERVYENDLADRLRAEGFEVHTQVPILVTYVRLSEDLLSRPDRRSDALRTEGRSQSHGRT